jgi:hypothetical protein
VRVLAALLIAGLAACTSPAPAEGAPLPPDTGSFDYQLGGAHDTPGLTVVARDASDGPMPGAYNVCYVNGFQTQPGESATWLTRYGTALLRDDDGAPVNDPNWPDEFVLDPSTPAQRATIMEVLGPVIERCAQKGFNAVELDNFDTFTRFEQIDHAGAAELARSYVSLAHTRGLAAAQKNASEYTELGRELGFDFAVAEECAAFDECASYTTTYGRHVLQIEYSDNLPAPFDRVCAAPDRAPLTILRDRDLRPAGMAGHVYEQCP